jgi:Cu+-exporting ATPase
MSGQHLVELQVEGMTCTNCASTVRRRLEKGGMEQVQVDFASGEVSFVNNTPLSVSEIAGQIDELGYHVKQNGVAEKKNS